MVCPRCAGSRSVFGPDDEVVDCPDCAGTGVVTDQRRKREKEDEQEEG